MGWYMVYALWCHQMWLEIPAILGFAMTFPAGFPSCPSLPCLITRPPSSVGGLVIPVATHGGILDLSACAGQVGRIWDVNNFSWWNIMKHMKHYDIFILTIEWIGANSSLLVASWKKESDSPKRAPQPGWPTRNIGSLEAIEIRYFQMISVYRDQMMSVYIIYIYDISLKFFGARISIFPCHQAKCFVHATRGLALPTLPFSPQEVPFQHGYCKHIPV